VSPVVDLHVWGVRRSLPAMRRMATTLWRKRKRWDEPAG
jgi:hypothetical protein